MTVKIVQTKPVVPILPELHFLSPGRNYMNSVLFHFAKIRAKAKQFPDVGATSVDLEQLSVSDIEFVMNQTQQEMTSSGAYDDNAHVIFFSENKIRDYERRDFPLDPDLVDSVWCKNS